MNQINTKKYALIIIGFWIITISFAFLNAVNDHHKQLTDTENVMADIAFKKDIMYRKWAAKQGGVYVPISKFTPPNPYLTFIKKRDIITTDNDTFTLVNPAYMTRQALELSATEFHLPGHLTSLKLLNPINKPDAWEKEALLGFEKGDTIYTKQETRNGIEYVRVIRPFITEQNCLKCHEHQDYKIGDIRGGLSLSIPVTDLYRISAKDIKQLTINYLALLIIGILLIVFIMYKLNKQILSRVKAELLLKESEGKFRGLFTQMNDGFALHEIIYDSAHKAIDYKIININPGFEKQIGIPAKKAEGTLATKLYGVSPAPFLDIYSHVAETREPNSFQTYFQPLDKHFEISVFSPMPDYFATVFTDITERKHTEEQINQLSQAVKQSPVTIVITDLNGDIEYVNPKFTATTGYSFEEALGKNPKILKSGELPAEQYKILWDTIVSGHEWRGEFHNKKKNGELYWEFASISPIKNKEGITTHFLAVKEEITERKQSELALKMSEVQLRELNVTKDKLFSIIAHDLRSPFNTILGFTDVLIENIKDFEVSQSEEYLGLMNSTAKKTLILLDNLLNWAKVQTGNISMKPEKIVLSSIIQQIVELSNPAAKIKNINLNQIQVDEIEIYADKNMLDTILRNLISNAIKFTNPGGRVNVSAISKQNQVEISISDNGVGMNEETRNKLFIEVFK